jgi:hypothetical protein
LNHWNPSGAVPVVATLKFTVPPTAATWLTGWVVMDGRKATVKAATRLVTLPPGLLTTTL